MAARGAGSCLSARRTTADPGRTDGGAGRAKRAGGLRALRRADRGQDGVADLASFLDCTHGRPHRSSGGRQIGGGRDTCKADGAGRTIRGDVRDASSELSMTEKVKDMHDVREPTLPAAENAAAVPPGTTALEPSAMSAPPPPAREPAEAKIPADSMVEAELPVVAKVAAPKIERTEEQIRRAALVASQEWHVARPPQGHIFSRRITAAQSTYRQVFNELDRRPMPTYKPGEPLDPLLELRENPRLLQSALDEVKYIRAALYHLPG